jgi:hypothetical protein
MDIKSRLRGASGVHEMITQGAAIKAGFSRAQIDQMVKGNIDNDFSWSPTGLIQRHYGNDAQSSHCLRRREHTGPDGDRRAVEATKSFILERTLEAWDAQRRGQTDTAMFQLGKAVHTLQDSYSHADRDFSGPQGKLGWGQITHVRSFLGNHADHDARIDTGLVRPEGSLANVQDRSPQYHEAWNASEKFLRLVSNAGNIKSRDEAARQFKSFLDEHLSLRKPPSAGKAPSVQPRSSIKPSVLDRKSPGQTGVMSSASTLSSGLSTRPVTTSRLGEIAKGLLDSRSRTSQAGLSLKPAGMDRLVQDQFNTSRSPSRLDAVLQRRNTAPVRPSGADRSSPLASTSFQVQRGQRLWNLAPSFGYQNRNHFVRDFKKLNPGVDPNRIFAGGHYNMPTRMGPMR